MRAQPSAAGEGALAFLTSAATCLTSPPSLRVSLSARSAGAVGGAPPAKRPRAQAADDAGGTAATEAAAVEGGDQKEPVRVSAAKFAYVKVRERAAVRPVRCWPVRCWPVWPIRCWALRFACEAPSACCGIPTCASPSPPFQRLLGRKLAAQREEALKALPQLSTGDEGSEGEPAQGVVAGSERSGVGSTAVRAVSCIVVFMVL